MRITGKRVKRTRLVHTARLVVAVDVTGERKAAVQV
jgi:hypothetical protein